MTFFILVGEGYTIVAIAIEVADDSMSEMAVPSNLGNISLEKKGYHSYKYDLYVIINIKQHLLGYRLYRIQNFDSGTILEVPKQQLTPVQVETLVEGMYILLDRSLMMGLRENNIQKLPTGICSLDCRSFSIAPS